MIRKEVNTTKKFVKVSMIIGIISVLMLFPMMVQASSLLEDAGVNTSRDYAEDTQYVLKRASHLSHGNTKLTELSSNSVSVYGLTQCLHTCDNVYLSLYLERKVNGSYSTYKSYIYNTTDATSLSKSLVVSVPTGYYYRVRGYHAAKCDGATKESISTLSSGIYVG